MTPSLLGRLRAVVRQALHTMTGKKKKKPQRSALSLCQMSQKPPVVIRMEGLEQIEQN